MTTNARTAPERIHKAAVLLATLSADESAALLSRLEAHQARAIAQEMRRLDTVDAREQQGVMREFVADGLESRRRSPRVSTRPAEDSGSAPCLTFLQELDTDDLLASLENEHPQTIALIFSQLPVGLAAAALAGLPADVAPQVRRRMARMSPCSDLALGDVAAGLRETLSRLTQEPAFPRISVMRSSPVDQSV